MDPSTACLGATTWSGPLTVCDGRLRREMPELRSGPYRRLLDQGPSIAFGRGLGLARVVVLANAGTEEQRLPAADVNDWLAGRGHVAEKLGYGDTPATRQHEEFRVPARSVALVTREEPIGS